MRAAWVAGLVGTGLFVAATMAGTAGCASSQLSTGFTSTRKGPVLPLGVYEASARMTQMYGIVEWRFFAGRAQLVITGYRADGSPARGVQLAWFKATTGAAGHMRLMMLDGSGAALRRDVKGKKTGGLTALQTELVHTMEYDVQRAPRGTGGATGASFGGARIRVLDVQKPGGPTMKVMDLSSGGTTPGSGPQCTEAWMDPAIPVDAASCAFGAATFEDVIGGLEAIASCSQWAVDIGNANATCNAEDSANCNSDGTCNFGGAPEAAAPAPTSACDTACLCANYPDTAQGCNTNIGPCSYDSDCSGGETCQPAQPGWSSKTCQPPAADADGGAGGDDGGTSGAGDDSGSSDPGDDGGAADPGSGDDGGGGDPGTDPGSGDDGGATDPQAPPTDDQLTQATDDATCPSCQGTGSDISANPANGDVSVTTPGSDDGNGNGQSSSTSDTTDNPSGGSASGSGSGGGSSSSTGGGVGGDDGSGDATQDQGYEDQASQDQASQDQTSQDQASQDQGSQDQASQDQASQDQASQDQSSEDAAQDAMRPRHHRHHKRNGWKRLYDSVVQWLGG